MLAFGPATVFKRDSNKGVFVDIAKYLRTPLLKNICKRLLLSHACFWAEAVVQMCLVKKVFLKVPQNSQEDTYSRDSFLINLPKRDSGTVISLWIFLLIKTFFVEHPRWLVAYKLELFYLSNKYIVFREFKMGYKPVSGLKMLNGSYLK